MRNLAIIGLILGVISINCVQAQSYIEQKKHKIVEQEQLINENTTISDSDRSNSGINNYSLPFTEYFEGATFPPTDWVNFIGTNGVGNSYNWVSYWDGYEADGAFVDWDDVGSCEDWLVTPLLDLGTGTTLSYYEKQGYNTDYGSNYYIRVSTNSQSTHADFTTILSYDETSFSNTYTIREVDLSAYDGQSVYIAFIMINNDGDSWYIDNIQIEDESTTGGGGTAGGELLISEVADPTDNEDGRFVEIYNSGDTDVDLTRYFLAFNKNTNRVDLSGTIGAGETFIFAHSKNQFNSTYGFDPDQWTNSDYDRISGINSIYLLLQNTNNANFKRQDTYGVRKTDGTGTEWEFTDSHSVRKTNITEYQKIFDINEWEISTAYASFRDVTPGNHNINYYWDGSQNNEWDEYRNWTITGGLSAIPDIGANVIIQAGTSNTPDKSAYSFPYYFNSLTVKSGASFTLKSDNILKLKSDLTVEAGGSFNLESDADGAACFIPEGSIAGEANIERYFASIGGIPTDGNWHYFSPAISDMSSSIFTDQWLMVWDEPTTYWNYITSTSETLTPGKGYGVLLKNTYGNTISHTGTINNTDISSPNLNSTTGSGWQGWNLVGNPYTSSLDWEEIQSSLPAGIEQGIHYWDANTRSYVFYNNGVGTAPQYIPPMQGFFIHVTADDQTFTFAADARTSEGADIYYKSKDGKPYTMNKRPLREFSNRLAISSTSKYGKTDKAFIEFHPKASSSFDQEYDASKFYSNNDTIVEICFEDELRYSINVLNSFSLDGRHSMEIRYGINDSYTLSFDGQDTFDETQAILLFDKSTEQYYDLRENSSIEFYNSSNDVENRFEIVFDNYLGEEEIENNHQWLIYSNNGMLNIRNSLNLDETFSYQIYSADGKIIYNTENSAYIIDKSMNLSSGIYLVKVKTKTQLITKKMWLSK